MNWGRRVFIDSSAFFALLVPEDPSHRATAEAALQLDRENRLLTYTNFIRAECYTLCLNKGSRRFAQAFLDRLEQLPAESLVFVTPDDETKAVQILRRYNDKLFSFVDATCFVVMEQLRIVEVLTLDDDFRQYGRFLTLP